MENLITIKFYTKPYSIFLQRNGNYFLNKPRKKRNIPLVASRLLTILHKYINERLVVHIQRLYRRLTLISWACLLLWATALRVTNILPRNKHGFNTGPW